MLKQIFGLTVVIQVVFGQFSIIDLWENGIVEKNTPYTKRITIPLFEGRQSHGATIFKTIQTDLLSANDNECFKIILDRKTIGEGEPASTLFITQIDGYSADVRKGDIMIVSNNVAFKV